MLSVNAKSGHIRATISNSPLHKTGKVNVEVAFLSWKNAYEISEELFILLSFENN